MIEGFSFTNDIGFAFEQVVLAAQEKATLSKGERAILKWVPKAERNRLKKKFLKEAEARKKSQLFLQVRELENKIEESDLPSDVKAKMLEMTQYALTHDMNFFYEVKQQISQMKAEAATAQAQKKKTEKMVETVAKVGVGTVIAGVAIAPFIQVRYTPEEYAKRTTEYYENKIIDELVAGKTETIPPQMTYVKKQGSIYGKRHYQVEDHHKAEVQNLIVAQIQEKQKKAGIPVQTADKIVDTLTHMHPVKQRAATRAIYIEHPELKQKHDTENKQVSSEEILRAMVRRERNTEQETILALRKEQVALKRGGGKTADHRIAQLEKKITARQEKAASLGLFMEHFDAVMASNETTAGDLIKSGTTDDKVLVGAIVDQITSLDMTGFVAKTHTKEKAGLSQKLAKHSAPVKAVAEKTEQKQVKPVIAQKESQKPTEMRLVEAETKGISKHLKEVATQDETPPQIKEAQDKIRETVEKVQTAKQDQPAEQKELSPKVKAVWDKIDKKMAKMKATPKNQKSTDNQMVLAALARKNYRQAG